MLKNTHYFSHDSNARNDEKILEMRAKYGLEGVGLYWCLVEMLSEASGYKLTHNKANGVAMALLLNPDFLKTYVNDCCGDPINLFLSDGEFFWSESLFLRMTMKENKREKLSDAGKAGAAKRWDKTKGQENQEDNSHPNTTALASQCGLIASKVKESKGKESKEKKICAFFEFWEIHPPRNGKKLLKQEAQEYFLKKIKDEEVGQVMKAVRNYAVSKTVTDGIGIRDAIRFLKKDFWKDWIVPEKVSSNKPKQTPGRIEE